MIANDQAVEKNVDVWMDLVLLATNKLDQIIITDLDKEGAVVLKSASLLAAGRWIDIAEIGQSKERLDGDYQFDLLSNQMNAEGVEVQR